MRVEIACGTSNLRWKTSKSLSHELYINTDDIKHDSWLYPSSRPSKCLLRTLNMLYYEIGIMFEKLFICGFFYFPKVLLDHPIFTKCSHVALYGCRLVDESIDDVISFVKSLRNLKATSIRGINNCIRNSIFVSPYNAIRYNLETQKDIKLSVCTVAQS